MKKIQLKSIVMASLLVAGLLASCRGNGNQQEGEAAANDANGDIYGSERPMGNEGSGSTTGGDTVRATTTGNDPTATGAGSGTGAGTNSGSEPSGRP